jgi:hypothetical protein
MNILTNESLKLMAVKVASEFLSQGVPLTNGVANVAEENLLNAEQIRRLIEVVNQVTYLKLLPTAPDRTFEFPLASFEDVLALLTVPQTTVTTAIVESTPDGGETITVIDGDLRDTSEQEKLAYFNRMHYSAQRELVKVADREVILLEAITNAAHRCKEDELFLSKVAHVTEDDKVLFHKVATLVYGEVPEHGSDELFYESDLDNAREVIGLLKEAEDLLTQKRSLEADLEKSAAIQLGLAGVYNAGKAAFQKKVIDPVTPQVKRLGKSSERLFKAAEPGLFAVDSRPKKRDVWKSLQGPRTPTYR